MFLLVIFIFLICIFLYLFSIYNCIQKSKIYTIGNVHCITEVIRIPCPNTPPKLNFRLRLALNDSGQHVTWASVIEIWFEKQVWSRVLILCYQTWVFRVSNFYSSNYLNKVFQTEIIISHKIKWELGINFLEHTFDWKLFINSLPAIYWLHIHLLFNL